MTFPCIAAVRRFDPTAHLRFEVAPAGRSAVGAPSGRCETRALTRPTLFALTDEHVVLSARYDSVDVRSMALARVVSGRVTEGAISGWCDEVYAISQSFRQSAALVYIDVTDPVV